MAPLRRGSDNSQTSSVRVASDGIQTTIKAAQDTASRQIGQNGFLPRRCRAESKRTLTMVARLFIFLATWCLMATIITALPLPSQVTSSPVSELVPHPAASANDDEQHAIIATMAPVPTGSPPTVAAVLNDSPAAAAVGSAARLKSECPPLDLLPNCVCHDANSRVYLHCQQVDDVQHFHAALLHNHDQYSSLWLRISNSNFPVLTRRTFGELRVEGLQINLSNVSAIMDTAFMDVHLLKSLSLQDNLLTEIPVPALRRLLGIEMISMAGNRITSVPSAAFLGLPHLYYVSLSQNAIVSLQRGSFGPGLRQLALSNNRITTLNDSVQHLANLEWLLMTGNEVTTLRGQLVGLPSLTHLHVGDNRLTDLGDGTLAQLHQLKAINVSNNLLERIGVSEFAGLDKIDKMDLSSNRLTNISDDAFLYLRKLTVLHLANNKLTTVGRTLHPLSSLMLLDLSGNLLESFDLEVDLPQTALLRCLDLSGNRLTHLRGLLYGAGISEITSVDGLQHRPTFIRHLAKLEQLILSGNKLASIADTNGLAYHLPSLTSLLLDTNRISVLDSRMLPDSPRLQLLNVSGNGLSRVAIDSFRDFNALTDLDLSVNRIQQLIAGTFASLTRLQVLNVSGNQLERIDDGMLEGLRSLVELDVSGNRVSEVEAIALRHVPTLQRLSLARCRLTTVRQFLKPLHGLQSLNLGDNEIEVLDGDDVETLVNLLNLNISANKLTTIGVVSHISLPKLTSLRLDNNRLAHVNAVFRHLPHIQDLDLRNNRLIRIPVDTFSRNPKLRTIHIQGNPLVCDHSLIELFFGLEANSTHIDDKPWCINNVVPMEGMQIK